jgi:hypothetical protein
MDRAKLFLINYCKKYFNDNKKMNIIVDIARHSMREVYSDVLLTFLSLTQEIELFSSIYWRGCDTSTYGDVNFGDIEASDWRNIMSIVEKSDIGSRLIPIKKYINSQIEYSLEYAKQERRRKFLEQW